MTFYVPTPLSCGQCRNSKSCTYHQTRNWIQWL